MVTPVRRRAVAAIGLVAALTVGCSSSRDGGGGAAPAGGNVTEVALTENPDLVQLDFPELDASGDELCAALEEPMAGRGYRKGRPGGLSCEFRTPPSAASQDGSYNLLLTIRAAKGVSLYNETVTEAERFRAATLDDPELKYEWTELEAFPVGKAGFVTSFDKGDASEVRSAMTSGEESLTIDLVAILVSRTGDKTNNPVPPEDLRKEITGIVQTLNGDENATDPLATIMEYQDYPGLQDLGDPLPPMEGGPDQQCGAVATAAAALQMKLRRSSGQNNGFTCALQPADLGGDGKKRYLDIRVADYTEVENLSAWSTMDNQLSLGLARLAEQGLTPTLYELPAGDGGYLYYYPHNRRASLAAGYTVGEVYVEITLSSSEAGPEVTEAEFVTELADFLGKLGQG